MSDQIKDITVTRTMCYSPETYIACCEEENEVPTQEGFLEFVQSYFDEDFRNGVGSQQIIVGEPKILVEVLGGVAYCDDSRVEIIDHDNEHE